MGDATTRELHTRMEEAGHKLKRTQDGAVEYFDHGDFHGGPECELCYYAPCIHCMGPLSAIEPCNQYEKALQGFGGPMFKASWERAVLLAAIDYISQSAPDAKIQAALAVSSMEGARDGNNPVTEAEMDHARDLARAMRGDDPLIEGIG